jgi:hypothetical protein
MANHANNAIHTYNNTLHFQNNLKTWPTEENYEMNEHQVARAEMARFMDNYHR